MLRPKEQVDGKKAWQRRGRTKWLEECVDCYGPGGYKDRVGIRIGVRVDSAEAVAIGVAVTIGSDSAIGGGEGLQRGGTVGAVVWVWMEGEVEVGAGVVVKLEVVAGTGVEVGVGLWSWAGGSVVEGAGLL